MRVRGKVGPLGKLRYNGSIIKKTGLDPPARSVSCQCKSAPGILHVTDGMAHACALCHGSVDQADQADGLGGCEAELYVVSRDIGRVNNSNSAVELPLPLPLPISFIQKIVAQQRYTNEVSSFGKIGSDRISAVLQQNAHLAPLAAAI